MTRYHLRLAAAFVRGRLPHLDAAALPDAQVIAAGLAAGLRLHKFKADSELPRVSKVIGILRGLQPESLVDIGSGRGTFLWPLLAAFPDLPVLAIDRAGQRASDLAAVRTGGIGNLQAARMDVTRLALAAKSADGMTILEVLEHLERPELAARDALRVARRFVVVSVPSKPDENPEHIQLFSSARLSRLFLDAGAASVKVDGVLNHLLAVVRV